MKKYKSIFLVLLSNNIIRVVIGVLLFLALMVSFFIIILVKINIPTTELVLQEDNLSTRNFEQLDIPKIAGENGSIVILDEDDKLIFPKESDAHDSHLDIDKIPDLNNIANSVTRMEYYKNGQKYTLITSGQTEDDGGWFLLLNENLSYITSSDFFFIKNQYTEEDIRYLEGEFINETLTYKYGFIDQDNKHYTMIIHLTTPITSTQKDVQTWLMVVFISILTVYIIFIVYSIKLTSKKINRPLKELNNAMLAFSDGDYDTIMQYNDVNELTNVSETFNLMVKRLKISEERNRELMEENKRIIADVSHDFKTPITIINGYAAALLDEKIPKDKQQEYLKKIVLKSESLAEFINAFACYSKMEHPSFELHFKVVNVSNVVRDYIASVYNFIVENEFDLDIEIQEKIYYCKLDITHFNRCLENIVSNFVKYNPKGTTIHVKLEEVRKFYRIILENDGTEINKDIVDTIFEPFVTGDESRKTKGSGLGLSVVRKIILLHGGDIELITSQEVYKTSFVITLPKLNEH